MDFHPSRLKLLASAIAFFAVDALLSASVIVLCDCFGRTPCNCQQPAFYSFMLEPAGLLLSLAAAIVVYLVFSVLQKKK